MSDASAVSLLLLIKRHSNQHTQLYIIIPDIQPHIHAPTNPLANKPTAVSPPLLLYEIQRFILNNMSHWLLGGQEHTCRQKNCFSLGPKTHVSPLGEKISVISAELREFISLENYNRLRTSIWKCCQDMHLCVCVCASVWIERRKKSIELFSTPTDWMGICICLTDHKNTIINRFYRWQQWSFLCKGGQLLILTDVWNTDRCWTHMNLKNEKRFQLSEIFDLNNMASLLIGC